MSVPPPVPGGPVQGPWTFVYSNAGISPDNITFYWETQEVHWLGNHGLPIVNVSLANMDAEVWYNTACAMNFMAQAGGCVVMFFVVLILAKAAKRKTPIFILNVLSLLFGFFRGLFYALFFLSAWIKFYPYYTDDYSAIPTNAYAVSVVGSVFPMLMTTTVNLSLVLQAYTVTKNMEDMYRYMIIFMSALIFMLALGFEFTKMVFNCLAIVQAVTFNSFGWVSQAALYMETASIWFFSIVFTSKLVYTLYYRRKHGWKQWSGVRILAAMGGCTMIIPSVFAILEYIPAVDNNFPESGSVSLTLVALLLPLSSLWASMAIQDESSRLDINHLSGHNLQISNTRSNASNGYGRRTMPSARRTDYSPDGEKHFGEYSPTTINNKIESSSHSGRDSTEQDLEAMGVRIDKSYSLQSANQDGAPKK